MLTAGKSIKFMTGSSLLLACLLFLSSCDLSANSKSGDEAKIVVGAERTSEYFPILERKKIGLVVNHTSLIGEVHLVDSLLKAGKNIQKIFAPEHGFRGTSDAGEKLENAKDPQTGLPVISLYGSRKKPANQELMGLDLIVFDIQDVGARFYTYISTMYYVMEACAENDIEFLALDRPNPNGFYVDGPVLEMSHRSFVGMLQIPVVHGMTIAELALMINDLGWLQNQLKCNLKVVLCENYTHKVKYDLPVKPSPNLPNARAIELYPSLCFFEGTPVSIGRGTKMQFQLIGHPKLAGEGNFKFKPESMPGAKFPKHENQWCYGFDLRKREEKFDSVNQINLNYLLYVYSQFPDKEAFFLPNLFFDKLAGSDELRKQIIAGLNEDEIRASWEPELSSFKSLRKKYLQYPDFE